MRGILKTRSVDINNFQKFIDSFFLVFLFFLIFNKSFISYDFLLVFFINYVILNFFKLYESYRVKELFKIIPNIFLITCLISLFSTLLKNVNPYLLSNELVRFFIISLFYLLLHHYFLRLILRLIRSKGLNTRNAIFLGNKNSYQYIKNQLNNSPWIGYKIVYWFSPNKNDYKKQKLNDKDFYCSGGINELVKTLRSERIKSVDKLYFCNDEKDEIKFNKILKTVGDFCIPVSYVINWNASSLSLKKEYLGDIVALNIWNPESSLFNEKIKRIFDLVVSIIILIISLPIFLLVSILIKFSSKGPIIFLQNRYGLNGKLFTIYKFRTMYKEKNLESNNLIQVSKNDRRVTRIGKFLRRYSIDELPQIFNVIRGEMSLVGPRPHAIQHNEYYRKLITGYMQRHSKLPGITGLAQINGARGETNNIELMKKRVKYDIEYNNNWHLGKDISILFQTLLEVIKGKAY